MTIVVFEINFAVQSTFISKQLSDYKMEDQKHKEHLENLTEIRSLMEQASRFISLSGLTGVFAGVFAIVGALVAYIYFDNQIMTKDFLHDVIDSRGLPKPSFMLFLIADAGVVLLLTIGLGVFFSTRKARKNGQSIWNNTVKRMLLNLAIPLVAGGLFCFALLLHGEFYLVAPATLIFYGMALLNAGKYTLRDIKYLGISEIALGLIACYMYGYGLIFWTIGFGLFHILYGIIMWYKYER